MKKLKDNRGVTLVSLAVTIVIMMILTISLTASVTTTIELKQYNQVKEDIIALTEEVKVYYMKNGKLPVYEDQFINTLSERIRDENLIHDTNPNDLGKYYSINPNVLSSDLNLNCGEGNKNNNFSTDDLYVMNESSLTVYYLKGAVLNGEPHYTIIDDFSGGSFADEYYAKADLPIISVVTMESNGRDKEKASINDTVTLKMLANYTLTKMPKVTIGGHDVTTTVTWNGNIGTATYTLSEEDASKIGSRISLSIEDYEADGRIGDTINNVNFGNGVVLYEKVENVPPTEPEKPEIPKTKSYVGYYADFTGDGTIEGIIFADLAVTKSGTWNNNNWSSYGYSAEAGLKSYYISKTAYQGPFGPKDVLTPIGGAGKDRFYVMALEDFDTSTHYWYYSAYGKLDRPVATDYNDFGEGKANTLQMLDDYTNKTYKYGTQNDIDLWKIIQNNSRYDIVTNVSDSQKWFVPSKAEWATFGDYLYTKEKVTTSNYRNFGLSDWYWSSSQDSSYTAWGASFDSGSMDFNLVNVTDYVRLSATF